MTYKECMDRFGTDKPDLRFELELIDVTDVVKKSDFDAAKKGSLNSYTGLYAFALKNAVSMVSESKFIKKGI